MTAAIVIAAIAIVGIAFLVSAVKIVRPYQRGLVERLGRYRATRDPGLNLIMPFIETIQLVDMREQVVDVPPQEVITSDNVVVSVDAVVYYEATDPQRLVYNIADFFTAITKLAQTNLRNLIGDLELDRALTSRDTINTQLREVLDDATDNWGVRGGARRDPEDRSAAGGRLGHARPDAGRTRSARDRHRVAGLP